VQKHYGVRNTCAKFVKVVVYAMYVKAKKHVVRAMGKAFANSAKVKRYVSFATDMVCAHIVKGVEN
jgi:hypothetical protein